ncbi:hypothetical protein [Bradyrhizobium sp. UFLA05-153]
MDAHLAGERTWIRRDIYSLSPNSRPSSASRSIAYGLERIGRVSLRFPSLVGLATVVLLVVGALGIARIKVDDSLSQLFRSETPEFRTFEEVMRRFPSNEFDVLLVIEGKDLLVHHSVEKLRDPATDLQLIEGTRGIISLFSAREPPKGTELPAPLFPDQLRFANRRRCQSGLRHMLCNGRRRRDLFDLS